MTSGSTSFTISLVVYVVCCGGHNNSSEVAGNIGARVYFILLNYTHKSTHNTKTYDAAHSIDYTRQIDMNNFQITYTTVFELIKTIHSFIVLFLSTVKHSSKTITRKQNFNL